jgi:hypothetical protein
MRERGEGGVYQPTYKDAVTGERKRLGEIGRGQLIGPSIEKTTLGDLERLLLDDYRANKRKSLETAKGSMKTLIRFFGKETRAIDLTYDRLAAYVAARDEVGRKPATVRNELAALKRAFTLGERAGKAIRLPFPTLSVNNARQGFFEEPELRALLAQLPVEVRSVVEFA